MMAGLLSIVSVHSRGLPPPVGAQARQSAPWQLACVLVVLLICSPLPAVADEATGYATLAVEEYATAPGSRPHDAVPDQWGRAWYAAQGNGTVGRFDPATGEHVVVHLGAGAAPHGIIMGPDGAAWITDTGLNAIVRVDPDMQVTVYPLPGARANLNTAAFDGRGILWYTGQAGYFGSVDPRTGAVTQFDAPRGRGPYGIAGSPDGTVYYSSLAGSYLGRIDGYDGAVMVIDTPTPGAGARRNWPDSAGRRVAQLGGIPGQVWGGERGRDHLVVVRYQ